MLRKQGFKKGLIKGAQDKKAGNPPNPKPNLGEAVLKGKNFVNGFIAGYKTTYKRK